MVRLGLLLVLALSSALVSCSSDTSTPERQVLDLVKKAELAAEAKDLSALKKMVSEHYADDQGNDRQAVLSMVRYQFLRNEAIHLLVKAGEVTLPSPSTAEVTVFAAMAGEPVPSEADLSALRADIYRFELVFQVQDDKWLLVRAAWGPARPGDLL